MAAHYLPRMPAGWRSFDLFAPTDKHRLLANTLAEFFKNEVEAQTDAYNRDEKFNLGLVRRRGRAATTAWRRRPRLARLEPAWEHSKGRMLPELGKKGSDRLLSRASCDRARKEYASMLGTWRAGKRALGGTPA